MAPGRRARIWLRAHHACRLGRGRDVQRHRVGAPEQLVQARAGLGVPDGQLGHDVVEEDLHAHGLGQHRHLGADVAVAHDAQRLSADLVGVGGGLPPSSPHCLGGLLRDAAHEQDELADDQLRYRAGVGVGRVEDGNARPACVVQRHLVGADAEAAHAKEPLGRGQDAGREAGARPDADDVDVGDTGHALLLVHGLAQELHVGIAVPFERRQRAAVDALEEQDAEVLLGERQLRHGGGRWRVGRTPSITASEVEGKSRPAGLLEFTATAVPPASRQSENTTRAVADRGMA